MFSVGDDVSQCLLKQSHDLAFKTCLFIDSPLRLNSEKVKIRIEVRPKSPDFEKWSIHRDGRVCHITVCLTVCSISQRCVFDSGLFGNYTVGQRSSFPIGSELMKTRCK